MCLLICNFVLDASIEKLYFSIINLESFEYKNYLIPAFIFAIAIIQSSLSYLVIQNEIKKLGIEEKDIDDNFEIITLFIFILLSLLTIYLVPEIYIMFLGFTIYEYLHVEKILFRKEKKLFIISIAVSVATLIFAFAIMFNLVPKTYILSTFLIPAFIVGIIALVNNCLIKRKEQI